MEDLIGKTLGGYEIKELIGQGGMASVYRAYQPSLNREVAIKVLPPRMANDRDFVERFSREAKSAAGLEHPHILPIHDYGQEGDLSYIVMRYVRGGTLNSLIGKPLSLSRISELITQVADALDYAHSNDIVHRDVKPKNVLLDRDNWTLLTDFGVARMLAGAPKLTATGATVGTPAYISPEQGLGEQVNHLTDVYSLGATLFELLTGRVPFEGDTPMAVIAHHIYTPLPSLRDINPDIPKEVERVVMKAMAKDKADRFQSTGELAKAFKDAIKGSETTFIEVVTETGEERKFNLVWSKLWWKVLPFFIQIVLVLVAAGILIAIGLFQEEGALRPDFFIGVIAAATLGILLEWILGRYSSLIPIIRQTVSGITGIIVLSIFAFFPSIEGDKGLNATDISSTLEALESQQLRIKEELASKILLQTEQPLADADAISLEATNAALVSQITSVARTLTSFENRTSVAQFKIPASTSTHISWTPTLTQTPKPSFTGIHFCDKPCDEPGAEIIYSAPERSTEIFLTWSYDNMRPGVRYSRIWTMYGEEWVHYECVWKGLKRGAFNFRLWDMNGLRSGPWVVTLYIEGEQVAQGSILVEGDYDYWDPAGYLPCPDFD